MKVSAVNIAQKFSFQGYVVFLLGVGPTAVEIMDSTGNNGNTQSVKKELFEREAKPASVCPHCDGTGAVP